MVNETSATALVQLVWQSHDLSKEMAWRHVTTACANASIPEPNRWTEYAIEKALEVAAACRELSTRSDITVAEVRDLLSSQGKQPGDARRFAAVVAAAKAYAQTVRAQGRAPEPPTRAAESASGEGAASTPRPTGTMTRELIPYQTHSAILSAEINFHLQQREEAAKQNRENLEAERALHRRHAEEAAALHQRQLDEIASSADRRAAAAQANLVAALQAQISAERSRSRITLVTLVAVILAAGTGAFWIARASTGAPPTPIVAPTPLTTANPTPSTGAAVPAATVTPEATTSPPTTPKPPQVPESTTPTPVSNGSPTPPEAPAPP